MVWGLICATWNWRDDTAYVRMQTYMYNHVRILYNIYIHQIGTWFIHIYIYIYADMHFVFMCRSLRNLNSTPAQHDWVIPTFLMRHSMCFYNHFPRNCQGWCFDDSTVDHQENHDWMATAWPLPAKELEEEMDESGWKYVDVRGELVETK